MKKKVIITSIMVLNIVGSTISSTNTAAIDGYFFKLRILSWGGGLVPDYSFILYDHLKSIYIDSVYPVQEYSFFYNWIDYQKTNDDWDMAYGPYGEVTSFDRRDLYTEEGEKNVFRLNSSIPYNNQSEELQDLILETSDIVAQTEIQWNWQNLFMDKLVPIVPMFFPRIYEAVWSNTIGFENNWGFADSLPYLEFNGYHDAQTDLKEFNYPGNNWNCLNPLFSESSFEKLLNDLMFEPILVNTPDYIPLKTGVISDWSQIDYNYFTFELNDEMYWNPSYNTTFRNETSQPLQNIPEQDLLVGLKGLSSNGSVPVTAKDAVFTILAMTNSNITSQDSSYNWVSECYVDNSDPYVFHLKIDANPATPEPEFFSEFWTKLNIPILPEFFLNSTDSTPSQTTSGYEFIGLYPGIQDSSVWQTYQLSPFGNGKYLKDYYKPNNVTVLRSSPYWFGRGAIDGTAQDLDIKTISLPVITDDYPALIEFLNGKLDWVNFTLFPETRKDMQADYRFDILTSVKKVLNFYAFNLNHSYIGGEDNNVWLDTPGKEEYTRACAVRKAISYAIDRSEINDLLYDGEYFVNNQPNPRFFDFWCDYIDIKYGWDLEKAWEWMEAAGFERPYTSTPSNSLSTTIDFEVFFSLLGLIVIYLLKKKSYKYIT